MTRQERAQLVLLAALAITAALVPVTLAHLQLGFDADATEATVDPTPARDVERTLAVALDDAVDGIPASYRWTRREEAVRTVRNRLSSTLSAINQSALDREQLRTARYNATRAGAWAAAHCPEGPARQFGECVADRGVVVQERDGRTHVLAVAVDVRATGRESDWRMVTVLEVDRAGR